MRMMFFIEIKRGRSARESDKRVFCVYLLISALEKTSTLYQRKFIDPPRYVQLMIIIFFVTPH